MKKNIILIVLCLFLSGCTINYNLDINEDEFSETISGDVLQIELKNKNTTDTNMYSYLLNAKQPVFNDFSEKYYNKSLNKLNNKTEYIYSYTYINEEFKKSRIIDTCFENKHIDFNDNKINIRLSGAFTCAYSNEIKINLNTKNKVIANNANIKNKNTYTWIIDDENKDNVNLFISINKLKDNDHNLLEWSTFKTIGLIIIILLSITVFILSKKVIKK